ncbi:hypothetical protein IJH02_01145 [Candidatus Saccharibacteria bacterium]|nr:hypothetical protein [Candidatus Saccharibacteria bacterium]
MSKSRIAAVIVAMLAVVVIAGIAIAYVTSDNGNGEAEAKADVTTDAAVEGTEDEDIDTVDTTDAEKIAEFKTHHSRGALEREAIMSWLRKHNIPFKKNQKGEVIVDATPTLRTLFPKYDNARTNSAKRAGLSEHPISDAPEYVFESLTEADFRAILEAEKKGIGTKVAVGKKSLVQQDVRTMVRNVIVGLAHTDQISGLHFGNSGTVYELSSAVKFLLDETDKAWKTGKGIERWLEKGNDGIWYATEEFVANIIPVVAQIVDGSETSVEVVYAQKNWGLVRSDKIQLRRCELSTQPDNRVAIVYRHYFKDGTLMETLATNVRDRRPEIPTTLKATKKDNNNPDPVVKTTPRPIGTPRPVGTAKPLDDPNASGYSVVRATSTPTTTPAPTLTPAPTTTPYIPATTSTPTPAPAKNPSAAPTAPPNQNTGPGPAEVTPPPTPPTEDEATSQYQSSAAPRTGGTSQPEGSLSGQQGAQTSTGGQTTTDTRDPDGGRTENNQAETSEIPQRGSDTGGRESNTGDPIGAPD